MYLYHDSRQGRFRAPFGAVPVGTAVTLFLEAQAPAKARAFVRLWLPGERLLPMDRVEGGFSGTVAMPQEPGLVWYYFEVQGPQGTVYYGKPSQSQDGAGAQSNTPPESWQITVYTPTALPDWYDGSMVYQIFPDRFRRGPDWLRRQQDAAHPAGWKGTRRLVVQDWYDTPFYCRDAAGRVIRWPFFGGTLEGIREKLPYLQSLGVGVLYLNPIFLAASNHKYDTADYLTLDPGFGDEAGFSRLCQEAAARGIRIILDGVFNHTGDDSLYFNRYGNYPTLGAYDQKGGPYDRWYRFDGSAPGGYACWWGVDSLPDVNEDDPDFRQLICGEDGVIRKWLRLGASGWRLDVADELPEDFIRDIRKAAKAEKPDALVLGEVWEDASHKVSYGQLRHYLLGQELDCTMHYPFRTAMVDFLLGRADARQTAQTLAAIQENYPPSALMGALNLIGTHDTPRILTVLAQAQEPPEEAARESYRLNPRQRAAAKARLKRLLVMQFLSPGVPSVYYGDEAGMEGFADPFNRGPFPWGREDGDILALVRQLGHLRREYPVFTQGTVAYGAPEGALLHMTRQTPDARAEVYLNGGEEALTIPLEGKCWLEVLTGQVYGPGETADIPAGGVLALYREGTEDAAFSPLPAAAEGPRGRGLLCPLFSLPGPGKTGRLSDAPAFLDAAAAGGYDLWMLLPLCPVGLGDSPYSSPSLLAGDPRYIDPDAPVDMGGFGAFRRENQWWLDDHALFTALHEHYGTCWQRWPQPARDRTDLDALRRRHQARIREIEAEQYRFFVQWNAVRDKARALGIRLVGDVPIYAAVDSVETWAHRAQFQLDEDGYPAERAGCPPDYFAPEGQDWGNPLYRWDGMAADDFSWWRRRLGQALARFDFVRLDHFRGFAAYYAIGRGQPASAGNWMKGPGVAFFRAMAQSFGRLKLVAEDLGMLDGEVATLLKHTGLCGMNVWQFSQEELARMDPEVLRSRVVFSGTHDNQTLAAFLREHHDPRSPRQILQTLAALPAAAVIFPVQDVLGLGDEARINVPGVATGNWTWRMDGAQLAALARGGILGPED